MKGLSLMVLGFLATHCSSDSKKSDIIVAGAQAQLQMENLTGTSLRLADDPTYENPSKYTPTVFKMKILKIAIAQELDTTKYPASVLYIDADACTPEELKDQAEKYTPDVAEADRTYYKYIGTNDLCLADKTDTFIDLAQGSTAVNAALNAQQLSVLPGKYKHIMLDLCYQQSDTAANVYFKTEGMSDEEPLIKPSSCGWTSVEINPPLEITKDSDVIVKLNYSLQDVVLDYGEHMNYTGFVTGDNINCYLSDDLAIRRCLDSKIFDVTASVEVR